MSAFGRQFVVETLFLVVVALVAGFSGLPWIGIVALMAVAFLLVAAFEIVASRSTRRRRRPGAEPSQPLQLSEPHHVHVVPQEPEPAAQPVLERVSEPVPAPEPEAPPAPEPVTPLAEVVREPLLRPSEPTAAEEHEPEREPLPPPALEVVREPQPEPEPESEPEPDPEPSTVVAIPLSQAPREWNVWELERLTREREGGDPPLDEERTYLLVYLREFATPEGTLPADFDALVRESFGELLRAR